MKVRAIAAVILAVLAGLALGLAFSQGMGGRVFERKVVVLAPAIGGRNGASVPIEITMRVPGEGKVYFKVKPLVGLDLQASAEIALREACTALGIGRPNADFEVEINGPMEEIEGPSAGAALTIGFIALMRGDTVNNSVGITGMILPGGLIGPVGGIKLKAEALAQHGAKVFIVPVGQANETMGVEGLRVVEALSIRDAYPLLTGNELPKTMLCNVSTESATRPFKSHALKFISLTEETLQTLDYSSESVKEIVKDLERAKDLLDEKPYASACYAFTAYLKALMARARSELKSDGERAAKAWVAMAKEAVKEASLATRAKPPANLPGFEAYAAAKYRAYEAELELERAEKALMRGDLNESVVLAVYALARAETAKLWSELAFNLTGPRITEEMRKEIAMKSVDDASVLLVYAKTVFGRMMYNSTTSKMIDEAEEQVAVDPALALGLSVNGYADLASMFYAITYHEARSKVVDYAKNLALAEICRAEALGLDPLVAKCYYEYASTLNDSYTKISMYMLAYQSAHVLVEAQQERPSVAEYRPPITLNQAVASIAAALLLAASVALLKEVEKASAPLVL